MPPGGGPKRKRSDRGFSSDDAPRASPHRPEDLNLARQSQPQSPLQSRDDGTRLTRRQSKGNRNPSQPGQETKPPSPTPEVSDIKSPAPAPMNPPATNGDRPKPDAAISVPRTLLYEHITDDVVQEWSSAGREKIKAKLIDLASDASDVTLEVLVEEIVEAAITHRVDTQDVGLVIQEAISSNSAGADTDAVDPISDALIGTVSIIFAEENSSPHYKELVTFLDATGIDLQLFRLELSTTLLEKIGLVRDKFDRTFVRKQTNVLYRQTSYNLLREESEGFSKLVTEIFTVSAKELPSTENVVALVEKVKGMIGAFDLDVSRCLDVILDVFGSVLVKQFRFFVKFLRASPWWPRSETASGMVGKFNLLGGLPLWALPEAQDWYLSEAQREDLAASMEERDTRFWSQARDTGISAFFHLGKNIDASHALADVNLSAEAKKFIQETGTIPHASSSKAAQLLGFKLRFYAPGSEGESADGTPKNLIYLAALLIKIGFISLHDLYPHLWRADDNMSELKDKKIKEKKEREAAARPGAGALNALATAGALTDDAAPAPVPSRLREQGTRASTPSKEPEPTLKEIPLEQPDQKVLLLQNLLAIGALPEALFILGRFPWMIDLVPELSEYIIRILHHTLSKLYGDLRPLSNRSSLQSEQPLYDTDTSRPSRGHTKLERQPARRTLRWPLLDRDDADADGVNYRFYWDEWSDNIPVCRTVDDVFTLSKTLLPLIGAKIGQDTSLILKFTRIGKASLKEDSSDHNKSRWLDLVKRILLPSLSLTKANPGVINEVFELISQFSTETRYKLYLEWHKGDTSRTEDMYSAFNLARAETRDLLKKISKENIRPMARSLARIAYANPHIVITTALPQIESYDSIANVFVEGIRYFTDLGYDVLTWALVISMGQEDRVSIQADGIFTSRWLTALSKFIGTVYRRYNLMKPGPLLQYVAQQLEKGKSTDLIILEQLIIAMSGISSDLTYNDTQLLAMGGGPLMQSQTMMQLLDERHTRKGTAKRLTKALNDCGLVSTLLLAMAQQRQACIFQEGDAPLKAIGHQFDEITRILAQYLDLLRTNLSIEEFSTLIPSVASMLTEWDIPSEIAFWITRPVIQKQITDFDRDNIPVIEVKDTNGDIDMKEEEASEEDGEAVETEDVTTSAATPTEVEMTGNADESMAEVEDSSQHNWHPVLNQIMEDVRPKLPEDIQQLVGPGFYITFWQLSLYDISVPSKSYEDEMGRNKKKISSITSDRSNVSSSGAKNREAQIKALKDLNESLLAENRQHVRAYGDSRARLTKEKDQWFAAKSRVSKELNMALMEHCFLPRILLSPLDAYFCFKFAKMLHSIGTANFRSLGFYDNIFSPDRLASLFFMCTSREADNLGKFLCEVLKDLARWHKSKAVYEREAFGSKRQLPGFALKLENGKPQKLLDYDKFRDILYKWQSHLYSALVKCLSSSEYMHIRNAISIMRMVSPVFPAVDFHGRSLHKSIEKLRESDREDLKIASQALQGTLIKRQKEWLHPEVFRKGPSAVVEKPVATPEPAKEEVKPKIELIPENKSRDLTAIRNVDRAASPAVKDSEKTPSIHSRDGRSPSRAATPMSSRPVRDSSLRPPRPEPRSHDPSRRVASPPRFPSSSTQPSRADADVRNGYRDSRPPRSTPAEPRPDSRSGYPPRHGSERPYEPSNEASHRYPRVPDRPAIPDRDERSTRREHDARTETRPPLEDRRYNEREVRPEREPRSERDGRGERDTRYEREHGRPNDREPGRPSERDHTRGADRSERPERSERSERDYGRSEHSERRRDDTTHGSSRRDQPTTSSRTATPSAPTPAPAPAINPERAALIQANDDRPSMSIRGQAQDRARASRPTSPRREDDRKQPSSRGEREDRSERRPESTRGQPSSSQPSNRNLPQSGPPRESRGPRGGQIDMSHGRLEQDSSHRPASRSDRAPDAEPPSGPRSRPSASNIRGNDPAPPPPRPAQTRPPPSGPGGRHTRNNSYVESSAPPVTADTGGVHPDRLNNLPQSDQSRPPRPPPLQASPPSAPRGAPTGPASATASPVTRGPPAGPQSDVSLGRGQRHPMSAVNSTLAQAANGPRHPSGRGRGGMRQNSISFNNGMPPSPVGPNHGFSGPAPDLINDNPNGMPIQPRGPNRQDTMRGEDDRRSQRPQQHDNRDYGSRDQRDNAGYKDDRNMRRDQGPMVNDRGDGPAPPRNGPRGYPRGPNSNGLGEDNPMSRKHPRDEGNNAPYNGGGGRGGRVASEAKRPRRGG